MAGSIVIDMGRRHLRVLTAQTGGEGLTVRRAIAEPVPPDLDRHDPERVGAWLGGCLKKHGISRGAVTVALARELVGLKRMRLPSRQAEELPAMTRLAMERELPFDADGAVIDFVPGAVDDASTTVLAVAVPPDVLEFTNRCLAAAGLSIGRIALRAMGAAALIADQYASGGTMLIDVTGGSCEFCVVDDGHVRFARGAELPVEGDLPDIARSVVTETRRTWLSYRIVEQSRNVDRIVLLGHRAVTQRALGPVADMLGAEAELYDGHHLVRAVDIDMDELWPLAGLLLEPRLGREMLDFAHPRETPDLAGRTRRRAIIAAGVAAVVALGGWTAARLHLDGLESQLARLRASSQRIEPEYVGHIRSSFRLDHLSQWEAARVDWLGHAAVLATRTPPAERVVLDAWTGTAGVGKVTYDRRTRRFSVPREVSIVLDGEASDRVTADAFRETLVESDGYAASSTGADAEGGRRLPFGFTYRLRAGAEASPPTEEAP